MRLLTARLRNISLEIVHEKVYGQVTLSVPKQSLLKESKIRQMMPSFRSLTFKNSGETFTSVKRRQLWNVGQSTGFNKWYRSTKNVFSKSIEKDKNGINTQSNLMNAFLSPYFCCYKYLQEVWCKKRVYSQSV